MKDELKESMKPTKALLSKMNSMLKHLTSSQTKDVSKAHFAGPPREGARGLGAEPRADHKMDTFGATRYISTYFLNV